MTKQNKTNTYTQKIDKHEIRKIWLKLENNQLDAIHNQHDWDKLTNQWIEGMHVRIIV